MKKELRALSVTQPWAECIISQGKNVENRSWNTNRRGYIAIHASSTCKKEKFQSCENDYGLEFDINEVDYGKIIGFAKIVDVITEEDVTSQTEGWFEGEYGFVLADIIKLKEPVEVKGTLSFWKLKGKALEKCLTQLNQKQIKRLFEDSI